MGVTTLSIEVANSSDLTVTERLDFIVDSGAVYSVVPRPVLSRLGIRPIRRETFRLGNGSRIERDKGVAVFRYLEYAGGADVVFGEEGDATLLGALSLEALGLSLDPIRRELKPTDLIL